jgi:phage terminase large subunit
MVRDLFGVEPDAWQVKLLERFPREQRIAMKASKGVGKTALLAWIAWNFLLTRPHPKIAATSISADNLADNLWTEMAMWQGKSDLLKQMFQWSKTRISMREAPETWWMSARSWSKTASSQEQSNTLAGLHADYILFLLDESGGMPDAIMASAEAALSSCKEGHIVQAGNPTHLEGPLYRASTSERRLWHVVEISGDPDDKDRAPRVSVQWAREQIEKYGRENPFVLVNVFGQFPPASLNVLIGPDEISAAQRRSYHESDVAGAARILGVDVARFGDDASVIFPRQGLVAFNPMTYRNLTGTQGAGVLARKWGDWDADAAFVDDTGGYGAAWIDGLHRLGRAPIGIAFSMAPNDPRYMNKRAEMYFEAVEWIKRGGQLPPADATGMREFVQAMTQTAYSFKGDKLLLEPKETLKARIGISPDHADAFALTFAQPVSAKSRNALGRSRHLYQHDPFAEMNRAPSGGRFASAVSDSYNPFGGH